MEDQNLGRITKPLLKWFYENARELPWREKTWLHSLTVSRELYSYHVWVSEIMLQQTRVEAVKPYYRRFLTELPDIRALAACEESRLLKLWEGLGYYNRVRNMQKAAVLIQEAYNGIFPDSYETLLKLPGIGSYTAGAIASISCGEAVPAVDGNVLRVISRIEGIDRDITLPPVKKEFESMIRQIIPQDCPGDFNQALMELGAVVCIPNGVPDCAHCPVRDLCVANLENRQSQLPVKQAKKARRTEEITVLVLQDQDHVVIRKRPAKGLLAGLYELPNYPGHLSDREVLEELKKNGFSPIRIKKLPSAKHIFTHVEWHMDAYQVLIENCECQNDKWLFAEPELTEREYPIPSAFSAYTGYLNIRLGAEKLE